jgi:rsbT co-antagonist protein RsbR
MDAELAATLDFRAFFDRSPALHCAVRLDGTVAYANPAWARVTGFPAAELAASPLLAHVHPDDHASIRTATEAALRGDGTMIIESRMRRADGSYVWLEWSVAADLERGLVYCFVRDVDAQKRASIAAERDRARADEALARLELIMRGARNGLWDYRPRDRMRPTDPDEPVFISEGLLRMIGLEREPELAPQRLGAWASVVHPEDAPAVERAFVRFLRLKKDHEYSEYRLRHRSGRAVWVACTWEALWDDEGGLVRFAGVLLDISVRKEVESELRDKLALIERQRSSIQALGAPVLEVAEGIVCMPVIGVVDSQRAASMMDAALSAITTRGARFLIMDLTGVDVLDTGTAERLMAIASAAKLLGAQGVVTGLRPVVAQTLVSLGVSLGDLKTWRTLKDGLRHCLRAAPG